MTGRNLVDIQEISLSRCGIQMGLKTQHLAAPLPFPKSLDEKCWYLFLFEEHKMKWRPRYSTTSVGVITPGIYRALPTETPTRISWDKEKTCKYQRKNSLQGHNHNYHLGIHDFVYIH